MSRAFNRLVARLLLAALLFAQGALVAYACPGLTPALAVNPGISERAAMPADCAQMGDMSAMDGSTPNLCVAHCQLGQQSTDHPDAPSLPPVMRNALYVATADPALPGSAQRAFACARTASSTAPPHSILHCCFRI